MIETSLHFSGLPWQKRLADFDFSFQPSIDRALIEELATGRFLDEGRNVIFQGPPGVGKTHLATAILKDCIRRKKAHGKFYETSELLLTQLVSDRELSDGELRRMKVHQFTCGSLTLRDSTMAVRNENASRTIPTAMATPRPITRSRLGACQPQAPSTRRSSRSGARCTPGVGAWGCGAGPASTAALRSMILSSSPRSSQTPRHCGQ